MTCKDLFGYQLVSISNSEIKVRKDDVEYTLQIIENEGDCCGYNDVTTNLLISESELSRNPVITNVEIVNNDDDLDEYGGSTAKLTFFGISKPLAMIESYSFSGSGWCYGACVYIYCKALEIDETLSCW